jgi:hypothetical protein
MRRIALTALLALLAGAAVGLVYAWMIAPARQADTAPNTLRADFKDQFRALIAASYADNHNLARARARLALLGDADPIEALTAQAQRMLASRASFQVVQQVAQLATDLRAGVASLPPSVAAVDTANTLTATTTQLIPTQLSVAATATAISPEPTPGEGPAATPAFDTPTARPTPTPIPTASAPFQLVSQDQVCNPKLTDGLMQISVLDQHRHQMPGAEIDILWTGAEETIFTGLKPEIADGYADYIMQAGVAYTLRVGRSGDAVPNLTAPACPTSNGQTYLGGLKLVFQQP